MEGTSALPVHLQGSFSKQPPNSPLTGPCGSVHLRVTKQNQQWLTPARSHTLQKGVRLGCRPDIVSRPMQLRYKCRVALNSTAPVGKGGRVKVNSLAPPLIPLCGGAGVRQALCGAHFLPGTFGQPEHTHEHLPYGRPSGSLSSYNTAAVRRMLLFPTSWGGGG